MVDPLTPEQVRDALKGSSRRPVLLDVREADEREAARIEPSLFIPMGEIPGRLDELPKDAPLVVYCHHGNRSMMVAAYLEGEGWAHVGNLEGGIDAWSVRVDPKVPRYT